VLFFVDRDASTREGTLERKQGSFLRESMTNPSANVITHTRILSWNRIISRVLDLTQQLGGVGWSRTLILSSNAHHKSSTDR